MTTIFLFSNQTVCSQEIPQREPSGQPGDKRPPLIEEKPPGLPPPLKVPPLPIPEEKAPEELPYVSIYVRKIKVTGSTVFSEMDLSEVTAAYENRVLSNEDLEALRKDLSLFYIKKGYITSGAIIPDQQVIDGIITLHIIEGQLTNIEVENNKYLRDSYYRKRIELGAGPPIKVDELQHRLRILQEDPRVNRLDANLKAGAKPGESNLNLSVEEKLPIKFWSGYNNYIADSVGGDQVLATSAILSLTESGDIFSFTYGRAEGLKPLIDTSYSFPLTADDLTLSLRYRKNDYDLTREEFEDLDVETDTKIYSIALRYPIYRSLRQEFALSLIGEHEKQETTLLDQPFSLEPGAVRGEVEVTPIRFAQEYVYRTQSQVIAAISRFTWGIDALDATIRDDDLPDAEFFKWQGQFQWARRFTPLDTQLIFRSFFQLTGNPLVSLEQVAVGGRYTVRGYPENFFVRDRAFIWSLESRIPIIRNKSWADYIQIVPFFDWGWAKNKDFPTPPGPRVIYSMGIGLRWAATFFPSTLRLNPNFEIFYGYNFKDVDREIENDMQDKGIHFQIALGAF
jgi:hemolysin activation/secretion protein